MTRCPKCRKNKAEKLTKPFHNDLFAERYGFKKGTKFIDAKCRFCGNDLYRKEAR